MAHRNVVEVVVHHGLDTDPADQSTAFVYHSCVAAGAGSVALGIQSEATGDCSFAFGESCKATGEASVAMGALCEAIGNDSVAMGTGAVSGQTGSVAMGTGATSWGLSAFACGSGNNSDGDYSFSAGSNNTVSGECSAVLGTKDYTDSGDVRDNITYMQNVKIVKKGYVTFGHMDSTERDALTAENGMVIYNTTTNKFQGYENGAWVNLI